MHQLGRYFLRGLVVIVPIFFTVYALVFIFRMVDGLVFVDVPGAGFLLTIFVILLAGFLASNFVTRRLIDRTEALFTRLPFVKLLYGSVRDLTNAFVGEKKRFDRPVRVRLSEYGETSVLGFLTRDDLGFLGTDDLVGVYIPQSYNFAGNMLVVRADQVQVLRADSTEVMAFLVSGGVSGFQDENQEMPGL